MGAVLYGDTEGAGWLLELVGSKADVSAIRDALVFGPELAALVAPSPAVGDGALLKVA